MMTKLTRQMMKYLMSAYQNEPWIIRVLWSWKVSRMTDGEIIKTYHMMTDRGQI